MYVDLPKNTLIFYLYSFAEARTRWQAATESNPRHRGSGVSSQTDRLTSRYHAANDQIMQWTAENDWGLQPSDVDDELVDQLAATLLGHLQAKSTFQGSEG